MRLSYGLCLVLLACQTTQTTQTAPPDPNEPVIMPGFEDDPPAQTPDRVVDGPQQPASGTWILRDAETGSSWNLRGEAFAGPMADAQHRLRQRPAFSAFWFAWSIFHFDTDIWTADGPRTQAIPPIKSDDSCDVPCNEIVGGGPPKDGIPSIDHDNVVGQLTMVEATHPEAEYLADDDFILGVVVYDADGRPHARAYSHNLLWWHEIANDVVADQAFTVTFCPLTGSGVVFPAGEDGLSFGTSGRLYNSNLVMYDRVTDSQWSQMLGRAITGPMRSDQLAIWPIVETTWAQWRRMWPDTRVATTQTGHSRDYAAYPYGDYRENHGNPFPPTNPADDRSELAKTRVLGVRVPGAARAYPYTEMAEQGPATVINDTLGDVPLAIVYVDDVRLALPFERTVDGQVLTFEIVPAP
jgi:hypothetical protein